MGPDYPNCLDVVSSGGNNPPAHKSLHAIACSSDGDTVEVELLSDYGCVGDVLAITNHSKSFFKSAGCQYKQKMSPSLLDAHDPTQCKEIWEPSKSQALVAEKRTEIKKSQASAADDDQEYTVTSYLQSHCDGSADYWVKYKPDYPNCLDVVSSGGNNPPAHKSLHAIACSSDGDTVEVELLSDYGCVGDVLAITNHSKSFFKSAGCQYKQKMSPSLLDAHDPTQCKEIWEPSKSQALVAEKRP